MASLKNVQAFTVSTAISVEVLNTVSTTALVESLKCYTHYKFSEKT